MSKKINFIIFSGLFIFLVLLTLGGLISYFKKNLTLKETKEQKELMEQTSKEQLFEKIKFTTEDGVEIVGDYYENKDSKYAGILIHMMPADKSSFKDLASKLKSAGYTLLAIDLRGHGESINSTKGLLDYKRFTDQEHQSSIYDIKSASSFLESKGFPIEKQFLIGASIGANLSLQFLSMNPKIKAAILLSPGLNYRGIKIEDFLKKELGDKLLVIVTKGDAQSYPSVNKIKEIAPSSTILEYQGDSHGTDILKQFPEIYDKIIFFLKEKLL